MSEGDVKRLLTLAKGDEIKKLVRLVRESPSPGNTDAVIDWMVKNGLLVVRLNLYGEEEYRATQLGKKFYAFLNETL